jgi:hypothetical protein
VSGTQWAILESTLWELSGYWPSLVGLIGRVRDNLGLYMDSIPFG